VLVLHSSSDLDLAREAPAEILVLCKLRPEHLDRDRVAIHGRRPVHATHASFPEELVQDELSDAAGSGGWIHRERC
jgi:hypothetical protein